MPANARAVSFLLLGVLLTQRIAAQEEDFTPPTPEQLAAQERLRPTVTAIWKDVRSPKPGEEHPRLFWEITDRLIALGPDVVPFLIAETDLQDPETFNLAVYSMGRIGGADAEKEIRKALRFADARGGRFGEHCKRYSLFSLALLGKEDAMELLQTGKVSMHGQAMVPDLSLQAHMALLIGPAAAPILSKQLDDAIADTESVSKLEDTLLAIARAGDKSFVPRLLPLLTHQTPAVRAVAADAISLLGEPALCEQVMPLLADKDENVRNAVGASFERWRPQPCYKAMVGRLEIETSVEVRIHLYTAIVKMGGENALAVLRSFINTSNQYDRAYVVGSIGVVGSRNGLNLLRALLADPDPVTVTRALQAISSIGGPGARDTLFAAASDPRPYVASAAKEILTTLGDKRVAPRIAQDLLTTVKDPVGNPGLRDRILALGEALVTLGFADPAEDLRKSAAIQTDPQIADMLNSCAHRLELIAKNKDDVDAWIAEGASPDADVRKLADRRLVALGTPTAIKALTARTSKTDLPLDERVAILTAIGKLRTAGAAPIVTRHLSDTQFDAWEQRTARTAAAYAARQIGGEAMSKALKESAIRRDGRDWPTLAYYAVLDRRAALPTISTLRVRRLRYPDGHTGQQEFALEKLMADLAADLPPNDFDNTPDTFED